MINTNFIIHEHARQYQWSGECFLSVKSFYNGRARYSVQQREYTVEDNNYLILNDCTKYKLTIDSNAPVESFCAFFSPDFVRHVVSELNSSQEQLLDFSAREVAGFNFLERNYQQAGEVSNILQLGRKLSTLNFSGIEREEFYYRLLNSILIQNSRSLKEADILTSKKKATRQEIYRRVYYAKDFIDVHFTENLTLKEIAGVALLSENHLLRSFKKTFKITPFQYITQLKIAEAKRQIIDTENSITEIATSLGYSSLSNFSYYFKNVVGLSPMDLRKKGDS